jgi:hypothetical protein
MTTYHLLFDDEFRQEVGRLSAAYRRTPGSAEGQEHAAVINAMKALQSGNEDAYAGKRLASGPGSYDPRDCAELKRAGGRRRPRLVDSRADRRTAWCTASSIRSPQCRTGASYRIRVD